MTRHLCATVLLLAVASCAAGPPVPAPFQDGLTCSHCRMSLLDPKLAAQIVAPGEDPRFYDDIGCLSADLAAHPLAANARAYVADHVSGTWIPAADAIYSRNPGLQTPMGSHLIAHATDATRAQDQSARGADRVQAAAVLQIVTTKP